MIRSVRNITIFRGKINHPAVKTSFFVRKFCNFFSKKKHIGQKMSGVVWYIIAVNKKSPDGGSI